MIARKPKQERYPTKRTLNLYYKPDRTTKPATIMLYVLFFVVLLIGLSKFLVYDLTASVADKEQEYQSLQQQLTEYESQLADYERIQLQYILYSATDEEASQVDRMSILALIDAAVRTTAAVDSVTITGDQAQVQISGITLRQAAEIVQALEASPIVAKTTINTASTTQEQGDTVKASILLDLQKEGGDGT
jgi:hypothetical protein